MKNTFFGGSMGSSQWKNILSKLENISQRDGVGLIKEFPIFTEMQYSGQIKGGAIMQIFSL